MRSLCVPLIFKFNLEPRLSQCCGNTRFVDRWQEILGNLQATNEVFLNRYFMRDEI
jgi:hypothetical protein